MRLCRHAGARLHTYSLLPASLRGSGSAKSALARATGGMMNGIYSSAAPPAARSLQPADRLRLEHAAAGAGAAGADVEGPFDVCIADIAFSRLLHALLQARVRAAALHMAALRTRRGARILRATAAAARVLSRANFCCATFATKCLCTLGHMTRVCMTRVCGLQTLPQTLHLICFWRRATTPRPRALCSSAGRGTSRPASRPGRPCMAARLS